MYQLTPNIPQNQASLLEFVNAGEMALQWVQNHFYQSDKNMAEYVWAKAEYAAIALSAVI